MAIHIDHVIVPSHNKVAAAKSLAGLLWYPWQESQGSFTPVYVNEALTLDFADRDRFEGHHLCFRVDDAEFDAIFGRIQACTDHVPQLPARGRRHADQPAPRWEERLIGRTRTATSGRCSPSAMPGRMNCH